MTHNQTHLSLVIAGEPVPTARARRGKHGKWYTPAGTTEYRERVLAAWMVAGRPHLGGGALHAELEFVFARPPSQLLTTGHPRKGAAEYPPPDVDNLVKGVLDALNAYAYQDDRQVVRAVIGKRYACLGEQPHTTLALAVAHEVTRR